METSAVRDINVSDVIDTLLGMVQKKNLSDKNLRDTISLVNTTANHSTILERNDESSSIQKATSMMNGFQSEQIDPPKTRKKCCN